MKNLSPGWISEILIRNYVIGTIFFSLIHIPLYVKKSQGIKFKFNPNWPEKIQKIFTFNKQIFDNLFWSYFGVFLFGQLTRFYHFGFMLLV